MEKSFPCWYRFLATTLTILTLNACAYTGGLKAFTTDGCSYFPDGTNDHKDLWLRCCLEHDITYWHGGTYKERLAADLALRECVRDFGEPVTAQIMLGGVRVGGSPYWPTQFRWGYGWPYLRSYKKLTSEELKLVAEKLRQYRQNQKENKQ
ncbi:MAG: hypothetical protein KAS57_10345 [Gammaproteobacteria bacterium]|nr:hypothetical protein [Gammaproteobacteria bacterium]